MTFLATYGPYILAVIAFVLGVAVQAKFPLLSLLASKNPGLADEIELLKKWLSELQDRLDGEDDPAPVQAMQGSSADPLAALAREYASKAADKAREAAHAEFTARFAAAFADKPAA